MGWGCMEVGSIDCRSGYILTEGDKSQQQTQMGKDIYSYNGRRKKQNKRPRMELGKLSKLRSQVVAWGIR